MAFCSNCGTQIADGAGFCSNCGTPVQMQAAPGAVTQAAEEVRQAAGEAAAQFGQAQEQVAQTAEQFGQAAQETAEQFGQTAQETAEQFGQAAQETAGQFGQPAMQMAQDPMQQQAFQQQGQAYAQAAAAGAYAQPQQKSKKGLIIGLVAGAVALIAIVVVLIIVLSGGAKGPQAFVGTWKFESMDVMGMTITKETLGMFMGDSADFDMQIVVKEDASVEMSLFGESTSVQGAFKDDKLSITQYGETIDVVIEDGKLVFSMEQDGMNAKMVFSK